MICSHPNADFEDVLGDARGKIGKRMDPRFEDIALAGLVFEPFTKVGPDSIDFAAGFFVPEFADGVFELPYHVSIVHRFACLLTMVQLCWFLPGRWSNSTWIPARASSWN